MEITTNRCPLPAEFGAYLVENGYCSSIELADAPARVACVSDLAEATANADLVSESVTSASAGLTVELQWHHMTQPAICVDLPQSQTQTQKHEMMCVFHPAQQARVLINGTALPGNTIERDFNGSRAQSASLANSETWVRVA